MDYEAVQIGCLYAFHGLHASWLDVVLDGDDALNKNSKVKCMTHNMTTYISEVRGVSPTFVSAVGGVSPNF